MNEHNTGFETLERQNKDNNLDPHFEFDKSLLPEEIINEIGQLSEPESESGLFDIYTANETIQLALSQPDPVQLHSPLILENEFIVCFADTGVGKTVYCFQIAMEIASKGYVTLFLDLELSRKQFQKRYTSEEGIPYKLPDNLYRLDFARLKKIPKGITYEDYFFNSLIYAIKKTNAKVIFLDNLTKLAAGDTDSAKAAIPILERLNELKANEGLTIIVLEHNKKVDTTRPIHLNDLQGSKMKSNLVDAVFTIGRSVKDKNLRYIKQIKVRDGEVIYDTENVKVCELSKSNGYLSFTDIGFESEFEHLKQPTENDRESLIEKVKELNSKRKSQREISFELGISLGAVNKYLKI
jgi:KaiC/GvpD/RAD55 family RecA-like ATPase